MKKTPNQTPLAVVTGASSGIGYELAIEFAKAGLDLVVVAENDALQEACTALRATGVGVVGIQTDLVTPEGVERVASEVRATGRPVGVLALNAGVGLSGSFVEDNDLDDVLNMIRLNVMSPVHLAKLLLPDMVRQGEGRVLFTSSIASLAPGPFHAVYHATKAFVQSFSEAIREELKDSGVTVTALMPGATDTQFFARAGMLDTKVGQGKKDDPAEVAKQGVEALMKGDDHVIAGSFMNKVQGVIAKFLPDTARAKQMRPQNEPIEPGDDKAEDAVEMLTRQHREADALFGRIRAADAVERPAIFKTLATKLIEHMMIEEDVFYPAASEFDQAQVIHSRGEHEQAKNLIATLLSLDAGDGEFLALLHELDARIQEHVKDEEEILFPECRKHLAKDDLVDLADEMRDLTVTIEAQGSLWRRTPAGPEELRP